MEALRTSAPIDTGGPVWGFEPRNLFLTEGTFMKTNELAHLLIELQHFDIRFKDSDVRASWDAVYDAVITISLPGNSIPRDDDYIDRLSFFLRRKVDSSRWYITNEVGLPPLISMQL